MTTTLSPNTIVKHLENANKAYYNGTPIMSDADFDALRDKLEEINPNHPFLSKTGTPAPTEGWPTHTHKAFMGSLKKIAPDPNNPLLQRQEWLKWAEDKGDSFLLSEKYDGSTVVATYKDGELETLATRGDGEKGENITPNARQIIGVPPSLKSIIYERTPLEGKGYPSTFSGEIRGEALLFKTMFEKCFAPAGYKNPRNAANGKIRDSKHDPLKSLISVCWFDVLPWNFEFKTELEKWQFLCAAGLSTTYPEGTQTAEQIWETFVGYRGTMRDTMDYEIDGLVVKINDLDLQESFGMVSNRPKGAIALKFPHVEKDTTVLDIVWGRGLTGVITPVAHLAPVDIGGVTITKASLCGIEEIKRLNVAVGDKVVVSRRNDVIPKIERVLQRVNARDTKQPSDCSECNEPLARNGAYLMCLNLGCHGEIFGNLMSWIKEHKIKGLGPSIVRGLISQGVTDVHGLYTATPATYAIACNSEKNGLKRYTAVQASSKQMRLSAFLSALNITALGTTNGQRLEKEFKTLDGVLVATVEALQGVPGIKTNARKIHKGLEGANGLIKALRGFLEILDLDESGVFAGKSFCVTGELSVPREKLHDWIQENGGETKTGVGKTLSYLVTNNPGSETGKNKKADKYGIPKITEKELYKMGGKS
jgi:DNA ligase (NAD+)